MIKCIVCDLDGTLIRQDDTMDERNAKIIKEYQKQGVEFIMATGRDINMVVDVMDDYDLDCELVLNNGNEYRNRDGSFQEVYPMDPQGFIKIVDLLKEYGYTIEIFTDHGMYGLYDADTFWDMHYRSLRNGLNYGAVMPEKTFTVKERFLRQYHYKKTPEEVLQEAKPLKIDARHAIDESISTIRSRLDQIMDLNISSSHDHNIEITGTTSNKGDMLINIMKRKGIKEDEVAVFGDSENDLPMMKAFKYSICPSNATKNIKANSFYVTESDCDHGAVYEGIVYLSKIGLLKPVSEN